MEAGESLGIGLFGLRALNSLRLEKNYGSWAREYRPIYGPLEAGLDRFVAYDKDADFIGKEAAIEEKNSGGKLRLKPSLSMQKMQMLSVTNPSGITVR